MSSVKWLEDELELNALHNPGSRRGSGNEKAAVSQRTALSAALGGRLELSAMSTISGLDDISSLVLKNRVFRVFLLFLCLLCLASQLMVKYLKALLILFLLT